MPESLLSSIFSMFVLSIFFSQTSAPCQTVILAAKKKPLLIYLQSQRSLILLVPCDIPHFCSFTTSTWKHALPLMTPILIAFFSTTSLFYSDSTKTYPSEIVKNLQESVPYKVITTPIYSSVLGPGDTLHCVVFP